MAKQVNNANPWDSPESQRQPMAEEKAAPNPYFNIISASSQQSINTHNSNDPWNAASSLPDLPPTPRTLWLKEFKVLDEIVVEVSQESKKMFGHLK